MKYIFVFVKWNRQKVGLYMSNNNQMKDQLDNTEELNETEQKNSLFKDMIEIVIYFAIVMLVVLFIYQYVGQQVEVKGSSMETTLSDKDRLILEKLSYRFGEPERYDIVVFRPYEEDKELYYIKRIIGLPGEKIQIIDDNIYINDVLLEEDYGYEPMEDPGVAEVAIILGEDEYFVLGDNRNHTTDSRYEVGNVKKDAIIGRTFARIWPFNEMEILKHQ